MENSAGNAQPGVASPATGGAATDRSGAGKSDTAFRTISEVAALLETQPHVLRFWESRFPQVSPVKRAGGRRYYRPADVALLAGIRKLLHDDGLTIRGVQKMLRAHGARAVTEPAAPEESAGPDTGGPAAAPDLPPQDHAEAEAPQPAGDGTPEAPQTAEDVTKATPPAADPLAADPEQPARPRVLVRRRTGSDAPGLFSLMDAPEQPRPAAPEPESDATTAQAPTEAAERPLAALLLAADPALLAPRAKALAALQARLEAIRARRDCAGRGR